MSETIEKLKRLYEDAKNRKKGEVVEIGTRSYVVETEPWKEYVKGLRNQLAQALAKSVVQTDEYVRDVIKSLVGLNQLVKWAEVAQIEKLGVEDKEFAKQWAKFREYALLPENKDKTFKIVIHKVVSGEGEPTRYILEVKENE